MNKKLRKRYQWYGSIKAWMFVTVASLENRMFQAAIYKYKNCIVVFESKWVVVYLIYFPTNASSNDHK